MPLEPKLVSFDVFDTVVTRRVGNPESVFFFIGQKLRADGWLSCSPSAFVAYRRHAEARVRARTVGSEPTLDEIWRELEWSVGWPKGTGRQLMATELSVERTLLTAVPGIPEEIETWRRRNVPVRFVSDTYFNAAIIGSFLDHAGVRTLPHECWTSSDHRCSKRRGALFNVVLGDAGVDPSRATHIGNDAAIDGLGSQRAGMHSDVRPAANLTHIEKRIETYRDETDGLASAVAGASRVARLTVGRRFAPDRANLLAVATGVVAPVLTGYVMWLLRDAAQRGLKRLYFVSRDGQILKALAEELVAIVSPDLELRYLYGGRLAWVLPTHDEPAKALDWLLAQSDTTNVHQCLERMGMPASRAAETLTSAGIRDWENDAARTALKALILSDQALATELQRGLARQRDHVLSYLRQEGVGDPGCRAALVDVGWKGSLFSSLERLVGPGQPECAYHLGLTAGLDTSLTARICAYLFDLVRSTGYCELGRRAALLVETFCAGSEGVAAGYERIDDAWVPRLVAPADTAAVNWGVTLVHAAVVEFGRQIVAGGMVAADSDLRPIAADLIGFLWDSPEPSDAEAWGSYPMADEPAGIRFRRLASPYTLKHVAQAALVGHVDLPHPCAWPAGSRLITPPWILHAMELGARGRTKLGSIRRRVWRRTNRASPSQVR